MKHLLAAIVFSGLSAFTMGARAAEKTVTLDVFSMNCPACPYIIRQTLSRVDGVRKVVVSYAAKTAIVTYDDAATNPGALTAATARIGFPSKIMKKEGSS